MLDADVPALSERETWHPIDGGPPPDPSWAGPVPLDREERGDNGDSAFSEPNSPTMLDCERCGRQAFADAAALRRAIALGGPLLCGRCLVRAEA